MSITVSSYARVETKDEKTFETIREVCAEHSSSYGHRVDLLDDLDHCHLRCQKGGEERSARDCLSCRRLVNMLPVGESMLVRCLWTETDLVEDLMTCGPEFVTVSPTTELEAADQLAQQKGVKHLLVVEEERLVGIVSRADLVIPALDGETVVHRAWHCPWTVSRTATLGQVAKLMREKGLEIIPVVTEHNLEGIITRGDLRRVGFEEHVFGGKACACCGSYSGVLSHPSMPGVNICFDCLDP